MHGAQVATSMSWEHLSTILTLYSTHLGPHRELKSYWGFGEHLLHPRLMQRRSKEPGAMLTAVAETMQRLWYFLRLELAGQKMYGSKKLHNFWSLWFEKVGALIPVSGFTVERRFSLMNNIPTPMRSPLSEAKVQNLMIPFSVLIPILIIYMQVHMSLVPALGEDKHFIFPCSPLPFLTIHSMWSSSLHFPLQQTS